MRIPQFSLRSFLFVTVVISIIAAQHGMMVKERMAFELRKKELDAKSGELDAALGQLLKTRLRAKPQVEPSNACPYCGTGAVVAIVRECPNCGKLNHQRDDESSLVIHD